MNHDDILPVVLFPKSVGALEADGVRNISAKIMAGHCIVARNLDRDVLVFDASARAGATALQLCENSASRSASPILDVNVADVELAGVALASSFVVAGALSDGEDARGVVELEVGHSDIRGVTETSAASVWWVATADTGPGLEVCSVSHAVVARYVANLDVLNYFEIAVVLADAAHGESKAGVPVLVLDEDVGAVGFDGDVVVTAVHNPIPKCDVVGVDDIGAVSVQRREVKAHFLLGVRAVHIYVLQQNILGMDDGHGPHLTLHKASPLDDAVLHSLEGDLMRAAGVVVGAVDEVVPDLAITVELSYPVARPMDVLATKDPSSGLVLEANGQRVVQPVL
jgi:hypothetical protein